MRLDSEVTAALDAMADHRQIDFTAMCGRTLEAALRARQRSCPETHQANRRCGVCGLLIPAPAATLDTI